MVTKPFDNYIMIKYLKDTYLKLTRYPILIGVIKHPLAIIIHLSSFSTESLSHRGIKFQAYKVILYDNREILLHHISNYTRCFDIKKNETIVDAGGHYGLFSLYAAKKVGTNGKVLVFEPDPYNHHILKKNIRLNKLNNVTVIKKALYNRGGTYPFEVHGLGSKMLAKKINVFSPFRVKTTTLDHELQRLSIKKVNFIKMDIEGAEVEAITGAENTLKNNTCINLAIASYHIVDGQPTFKRLTGKLKKYGFQTSTRHKNETITYASKKM